MPIDPRFLKYIYSSAPLDDDDFKDLDNGRGIFKQKFYETDLRKTILRKLKSNFQVSEGGVFLISGYRGIGKTTFINYVLYKLRTDTSVSKKYLKGEINLSSIDGRDFKFELINKILFTLKKIQCDDAIFQEKFDRLYEALNFEKKAKTYNQAESQLSAGWTGLFKAQRNETKSNDVENKDKDNIFSQEDMLKDLLQYTKNTLNFKLVFVLDELDKMSFQFFTNVSREKEAGLSEKKRQMERLLQVLSEVKSLLFECGAIFVLIVTKDIYDYWKYHHNHDDLFMNLVTHVEYMPSYTKEEMELNPEFTITLAPDVDIPFPLSPPAIKRYFQTCAYYESYANPRLFFQILSRKIKNDEIVLNREEAQYLKNKVRLFELNDLIYKYVHEGVEFGFGRLLLAVNELKEVCKQNMERNQGEPGKQTGLSEIFSDYYEFLKTKQNDSQEFWSEELLYAQFETLLIMLKEQEHYFHTNYVIHRLTDFLKIIEERHFISITDVMEAMKLQEFESKDAIGRYLINLLIPLSIIFLRNNKVIDVKGKYIHYTYGYNSNKYYYHLACEAELEGDFKKAFINYELFFKKEQDFMVEAYNQKLRFYYYMLKLGFYTDASILTYWYKTLFEMNEYFIMNPDNPSDDLKKASFIFRRNFFMNRVLTSPDFEKQKKKYKQALFRFSHEDDIEGVFDNAIEKSPMDANIKILKGYFLIWKKKYAAALGMFLSSVKLYKEPLSMIRIGDIYVKQEKYDKAWRFYKEAMEISHSWLHKALLVMSVAELISRKTFLGKLNQDAHLFIQGEGNKEFMTSIKKELEMLKMSKNTSKCLSLLGALREVYSFLGDTKNKSEIQNKINNVSLDHKNFIKQFNQIVPEYIIHD